MTQLLLDFLTVAGLLASMIILGVIINWLVFRDG